MLCTAASSLQFHGFPSAPHWAGPNLNACAGLISATESHAAGASLISKLGAICLTQLGYHVSHIYNAQDDADDHLGLHIRALQVAEFCVSGFQSSWMLLRALRWVFMRLAGGCRVRRQECTRHASCINVSALAYPLQGARISHTLPKVP